LAAKRDSKQPVLQIHLISSTIILSDKHIPHIHSSKWGKTHGLGATNTGCFNDNTKITAKEKTDISFTAYVATCNMQHTHPHV